MPSTELIEHLRSELPRLLREHPEVRHALWGMMLEAFPSRQEFMVLLEELRAFREDSNRRFEAMDRRFEAVDRRFEEMRADMNLRFEAVFLCGDVGTFTEDCQLDNATRRHARTNPCELEFLTQWAAEPPAPWLGQPRTASWAVRHL